MNTKELQISYGNIEDAIASFLISSSIINDDEEIIEIDLPIEKITKGLVPITVTTTKIKR